MNDYDFEIAFSIESFENDLAEDLLDDPDYVEWVPYITEVIDDKRTMTPIGFHKCTQADFKRFYPIDKADVKTLKKYKAKGLLCLNKFDEFGAPYDLRIFKSGDWGSQYRDITLLYRPCVPRVDEPFAPKKQACTVKDYSQESLNE